MNTFHPYVQYLRYSQFLFYRQEMMANAEKFFNVRGFPGVVAVVDGTHIGVKPPSDDAVPYKNRKGDYTLNVQVITIIMLKGITSILKYSCAIIINLSFNRSCAMQIFCSLTLMLPPLEAVMIATSGGRARLNEVFRQLTS